LHEQQVFVAMRRDCGILTGSWKATSRTSFGIDYLYGHEPDVVGTGQNGNWTGFAGYFRRGFTDRLALCLRGEFFDADVFATQGLDVAHQPTVLINLIFVH
jgi:hypothetical protein